MRFGNTVEERSERLLLVILGVLLLVFAGLQVSSFFGGKSALAMKEKELVEARLMDSLVTEFTGARRLLQEDVGMAGNPLPKPVLEKLRERYTLTGEEGKFPLARATSARLRRDLGIDASTAAFILANRDVRSFDELAKRKRNLFEEHRATIEPLIVQRVSKVARESGIQKIDQFKVEPPKKTRRRRTTKNGRSTANLRPDSATVAEMNARIEAVRTALESGRADLSPALAEVVAFAQEDPTVRRTAAAGLETLLKRGDLSPQQTAQLRLAVLRAQPPVWRIASALLRAHLEAVRRAFPPEPSDAQSAEGNNTPSGEAAEEPASAEEAPPSEEQPSNDVEGGTAGNAVAEAPLTFEDPPFPPLVALPLPAQRRLVDRLIENGGDWLTEDEIRAILALPTVDEPVEDAAETPPNGEKTESSDAPAKPDADADASAENDEGPTDETEKHGAGGGDIVPLEGPEVDAIRRYQTALVETLWNVSDIIRSTRGEQGRTYTATLTFKGPLEQLVNLIYKLESTSPWMRVTGLRIAVADPNQPQLSVTLTMEATIL